MKGVKFINNHYSSLHNKTKTTPQGEYWAHNGQEWGIEQTPHDELLSLYYSTNIDRVIMSEMGREDSQKGRR